ncbi:MAG: phosphohistidine phosphatase SixA [Bdellovibrionota bacterium]
MLIYLVRHGIAEDPTTASSDAERRLTEEGREKTERVAKAFHKRVSKVDLIFHSPYLRALETAQIFSAEFPRAKMQAAKGLTPHDEAKSALPLLNGFGSEESVMIVGHEPHLSTLASLLLTGKSSPILEFKKAGVAGIESHGALQGSRLCFLLTPKWL